MVKGNVWAIPVERIGAKVCTVKLLPLDPYLTQRIN